MRNKDKHINPHAFTLVELMVVMAIIAAMLTVTLPFANRSNNALKVQQAASNIAQTLRYAINLSETKQRKIKFVFDTKNSSYYLEIANQNTGFKQLDDFAGKQRFIDNDIYLFDSEEVEHDSRKLLLIFDPQKKWPDASITFATKNLMEKIIIKGRHVDIKEISL